MHIDSYTNLGHASANRQTMTISIYIIYIYVYIYIYIHSYIHIIFRYACAYIDGIEIPEQGLIPTAREC